MTICRPLRRPCPVSPPLAKRLLPERLQGSTPSPATSRRGDSVCHPGADARHKRYEPKISNTVRRLVDETGRRPKRILALQQVRSRTSWRSLSYQERRSMPDKLSRQRSWSMAGSSAATSGLQPLPVPPGALTDVEIIAVAGVDAGAAINVLATQAQGPDATSAMTVLKQPAEQINAALAALTPPAPAPSGPSPAQLKRRRFKTAARPGK